MLGVLRGQARARSRSTTPSTGCRRPRCSSAGRPRRRRRSASRSRARAGSRTCKRLVDAGDAVARLAEAARALGDRLGPILFQLPAESDEGPGRARGDLPGGAARPGCARRSSSATNPGWPTTCTPRSRAHDAALCVADRRSSRRRSRRPPAGATCASGARTTTRRRCAGWAERLKTQRFDDVVRVLQARGPRGPGRPLPIPSEA